MPSPAARRAPFLRWLVVAVAASLIVVGVASAGYFETITAAGPEGYWRLGEASGTSAADASGHTHTGTYTGTVTLGVPGALAGDSNTAITFPSSPVG